MLEWNNKNINNDSINNDNIGSHSNNSLNSNSTSSNNNYFSNKCISSNSRCTSDPIPCRLMDRCLTEESPVRGLGPPTPYLVR